MTIDNWIQAIAAASAAVSAFAALRALAHNRRVAPPPDPEAETKE